LDPFFTPYPDLRITRGKQGSDREREGMISFGGCLYGEFDGVIYGRDGYERLMDQVRRFQQHLARNGRDFGIRPWHFEVDPYRGHSVIAAVGVRFGLDNLNPLLEYLKSFLQES
jgi:hypothetical protein